MTLCRHQHPALRLVRCTEPQGHSDDHRAGTHAWANQDDKRPAWLRRDNTKELTRG